MGTRIIRGVVAAAQLAMFVGWGCSSTGRVEESPAETLKAGQQLAGSFEVHVDPRAANPMTIVPILRPTRIAGQGLGTTAQAVVSTNSVLSTATLSGTGVWDATNKTLSATIGISNGSSQHWDEPYMKIVSISPSPSSASVTVTAVNTGTLVNGSGTAITSGGAGSYYGLADIPSSASTHPYALQKISFSDPSVASFSFVVDVLVNPTSSAVVYDKDDDTFNTEAFSEPAGGDCLDDPSSSATATGTNAVGHSSCSSPPTGTGCDSACPDTSGSSCPSSGTTSNCCVENNTSSSGTGNCPTATSGSTCTCDQTFSSNSGDVSFTCSASTDCTVRVNGPKTANVGCGTGSSCSLFCTKTGTTTCNITSCASATCAVTVEAPSGSAASVTASIAGCSGTSSCTVNCANNADCFLACASTTATCVMTGCDVGNCTDKGVSRLTCTSPQVPITCTTAVGKMICAAAGTTC